jgi:hypothetical protein
MPLHLLGLYASSMDYGRRFIPWDAKEVTNFIPFN